MKNYFNVILGCILDVLAFQYLFKVGWDQIADCAPAYLRKARPQPDSIASQSDTEICQVMETLGKTHHLQVASNQWSKRSPSWPASGLRWWYLCLSGLDQRCVPEHPSSTNLRSPLNPPASRYRSSLGLAPRNCSQVRPSRFNHQPLQPKPRKLPDLPRGGYAAPTPSNAAASRRYPTWVLKRYSHFKHLSTSNETWSSSECFFGNKKNSKRSNIHRKCEREGRANFVFCAETFCALGYFGATHSSSKRPDSKTRGGVAKAWKILAISGPASRCFFWFKLRYAIYRYQKKSLQDKSEWIRSTNKPFVEIPLLWEIRTPYSQSPGEQNSQWSYVTSFARKILARRHRKPGLQVAALLSSSCGSTGVWKTNFHELSCNLFWTTFRPTRPCSAQNQIQ